MEKIHNKNVSWIERVRQYESDTPGIMESQASCWQNIRERLEEAEQIVTKRKNYMLVKLAAACIAAILLFQPFITDKHKGFVSANKQVQPVGAFPLRPAVLPGKIPALPSLPSVDNTVAMKSNELYAHSSPLIPIMNPATDSTLMKSRVDVIPGMTSIAKINQLRDTAADNEPLTVWHENDLPDIDPAASVTVKNVRIMKILNNMMPDMTLERTGTDKKSHSKNQLTNSNNQN